MADILNLKSGKHLLLGNEAIVRGALEAGVQFVSTYPGTPASEIGNNFFEIASRAGVYFEFSTNEKVALESGVGASFSGLKTLVAMKNFGLNVAADPLMPFLYTGSKGPFVLVVADDPSCHSSAQSEQNSRGFSYMAHIPTLEPADPQECFDFVRIAFQLSEKYKLPFMVRLTTRVAHQKMPVKIISNLKSQNSKLNAGRFIVDKHRFVTMPPRVLEMKAELLAKIEQIRKGSQTLPFCRVEGQLGKTGIIASGVGYLYAKEALLELKANVSILKLGLFYPLPENKIRSFIKTLDKVLIVEELEPFVEKEVMALAKTANPKIEIFGKDLLPQVGELRPEQVAFALAKILGKRFIMPKSLKLAPIKHLPRFCTGWPTCPYWKLFAAVKQAAPKNTIFGGDIGCYMMAALPPHNLYDYISCMGSSIGIGHGIKKATNNKQKIIVFIGDGTFFHAGIPALINAVYNQSNLLVIILDNRITAMTGHQPNPGMGTSSSGEPIVEIKIENIVKALQVKHLKVIDQEEKYAELVATIKDFLNKKEVSVIIARRICGLLAKRLLKK